MVFLFSRNFPDRRLLSSALQSFFGLGPNITSRVLARFHLHGQTRMRDLSSAQILEMNAYLDAIPSQPNLPANCQTGVKVENELKRDVLRNIARLKDIGTYRGRRHAMGLPVRGQRTRGQIKTVWRLNRAERNL